ncbi:MAG TPA: hypothetical protein VIM51_01505 [Desulfosporosinus sp.]
MMVALNRKSETGTSLRRQRQFQVGDRVSTNNSCLGTVIRIDRDDVGDYVVVRLDILTGDFDYDLWELEKI